MTLTIFSSGTKAKASEVNENFGMSYYQGGLNSTMSGTRIEISASTATLFSALNISRISLLARNNSSNTIYVGDINVTIVNGFPVIGKQSIYFKGTTNALYSISSSGTADLRYLEV